MTPRKSPPWPNEKARLWSKPLADLPSIVNATTDLGDVHLALEWEAAQKRPRKGALALWEERQRVLARQNQQRRNSRRAARCERRAYQMVKSAPTLVAFDTDIRGRRLSREQWLAEGRIDRYKVVWLALLAGQRPDHLQQVIATDGPSGPDRLLAAWWVGVLDKATSWAFHSRFRGWDCRELLQPIDTLLDAGLIHRDAVEVIRGSADDKWAQSRRLAKSYEKDWAALVAKHGGESDDNR